MGWIVGVRARGSSLLLVEARDGDRREVPPVDALLVVQASGSFRRTRFHSVTMSELTLLDSQQAAGLADALQLPAGIAEAQSFYAFEQAGRRFVLPSQVLIHALIGGSRAQRAALFCPAGYDLLGHLSEEADRLEVSYWTSFDGKPPTRFQGLAENILWTGCYPSARRMHRSVFRAALAGRLDLELPAARVMMSFVGVDTPDGGMFVTRALRAVVEPLEAPMKHAEGLVATKFTYIDIDERRVVKGEQAVGRRGPWSHTDDPDLLHPRFEAALSDSEWQEVRTVLMRHRERPCEPGQREREKVDIILKKLATGRHWTKVAGSAARATLVQCFFAGMERNGCWSAVRQYLLEARPFVARPRGEDDVLDDADARCDYSPRELRSLRTDVAKMTQVRFAALLKVGVRTVCKWEGGDAVPTHNLIRRKLRLLEFGGVEALASPSKDGQGSAATHGMNGSLLGG